VCKGLLHTGGSLRTEEKLHKEIRGLEGRGEGLWEAFYCLWAAEVLQREQDSFWVDSFYNTGYISTYMIIQSWGFRLRLSPSYIFCVMCDWFVHISYMCSYWCCSCSIKLPQSVVEVDLVLCFGILHNMLIYSGNFFW